MLEIFCNLRNLKIKKLNKSLVIQMYYRYTLNIELLIINDNSLKINKKIFYYLFICK